MITVFTMPSLDDDLTLPLKCSVYIGHPPSVDQTGRGTASTFLETMRGIGVTAADQRIQMNGMTKDGNFRHTKFLPVFN